MRDPAANPKRENAVLSGFARFGGLDQLDWLMILISVLLGLIWGSSPDFSCMWLARYK